MVPQQQDEFPRTNAYLSVRQAAERLGCSKGMVYKLIREGSLVATIGKGRERGMRVTESAIAQYFAEFQQVQPSRPRG